MAQGGDRCLWAIGAVLGLLALALAVALRLLFLQFLPAPPRYYASILSIIPIDSTTLEFNICLPIQCMKPLWGRTCLAAGTGVEVAYRGPKKLG
jgi:hypothetical protein